MIKGNIPVYEICKNCSDIKLFSRKKCYKYVKHYNNKKEDFNNKLEFYK
jgi:hypothetical protein